MKCLILAAGYATRLYPLTQNFPKPLLKVGDKAILDWLVDDIAATGMIDGFVVVINHRFCSHFHEWVKGRPETVTIVDDGTTDNKDRLGAVRDIQLAVDRESSAEDMLVIAGDNLLDFSFRGFLDYAKAKGTSCVMCHEENDLKKQQKTAIITFDADGLIASYEEKPAEPKGNHAVPPFYYYRAQDLRRVSEALQDGCGADAPGSFAAWLSRRVPLHAWRMPGNRYDIGDAASYARVQEAYQGIQPWRNTKTQMGMETIAPMDDLRE